MEGYSFRVPVPDHLPQMHFTSLIDAKEYACACLWAARVDFRHPDGVWRTLWQDGELVYTQRGAVLVPYRVEGV